MSNEKTVHSIRLDDIHWELIEQLEPFYGSNKGEVCRNIILMWLHENLGSPTLNLLREQNAVKLKKRQREYEGAK